MNEPRSMPIEVHVSLVGRKDITNEIYRQLRAAILDGRLKSGDRLPPTRELAARLSVSRTTVMDVYDRLYSEGYTESRAGSGTRVSRELLRVPTPAAPPSGALRARRHWASVAITRAFEGPVEFDFRAGTPDTRLFPFETWRRLQAREWRRSAPGIRGYGQPAGDPGLREAIAAQVAVGRGIRTRSEDIIVTNGTQQGADIVARALLAPGDLVAVEDPGYGPPRRLFESLGLRIAGVRVDTEGLVVDELPSDARLVFVSPSHQFPLGTSMSLPRRLALIAWAEGHDAAILEDDYDTEFRFSGRPIEPLQLLDSTGRVIYVGTFSKSLLPALRVGFLVVPQSIRDAIEAAKFVTDWHTSVPTQRTLASFITDGSFGRHVRRMRIVYRERHDRIMTILRRDLPEELEVLPASAGVHISALARTRSVDQLASVAKRALGAGVLVQLLASFAVGEVKRSGLLLGYGAIATEHIDEGLRRLTASFDESGRRSADVARERR
jgi:GntR family transcriptional regulator / MocR family aminotransferase